jgi:hypothetical protein
MPHRERATRHFTNLTQPTAPLAFVRIAIHLVITFLPDYRQSCARQRGAE